MRNSLFAGILLGMIGQAILVVFFLVLLPMAAPYPHGVLWLDLVVSSIVYWAFGINMFISPAKHGDRVQARIGALGIRYVSTMAYGIIALIFMAYNLLSFTSGYALEVEWQIFGQGLLLFLYLMMLLMGTRAQEQTKEAFERQTTQKAGKLNVRRALGDLSYTCAETAGVPQQTRDILMRLAEEGRYITPMDTDEAATLDASIISECDALRAALVDYEMNARRIPDMVQRIQIRMQRRRSLSQRAGSAF